MLCLMIGRVGYGQEVWELVTDYDNLSTTDTYVIAGNDDLDHSRWHTLKNHRIQYSSSLSPLPIGSTLTLETSQKRILSDIDDYETWLLLSTDVEGEYYIKSTQPGDYYLQASNSTGSFIDAIRDNENAKWRIHYTIVGGSEEKPHTVTGLYNENRNKMLAIYYTDSYNIDWRAYGPFNFNYIPGEEVVLFRKVTTQSASITSAEYATFSSPYALDFSAESGLTVYTATVNAAKMKVSLHEVTSKKIPANTAVVLHGTQGTYTGSIVETAENLVGNDLKVATSEMSGAEHSIYVLNKKNGVLGFYKLSNTGKLEAGKAYLTLNASAPMLTFTADEVTSVGHARSSVKTDSLYFTLDGRRVMYPSRGVFIHNGRKVVIK